MLAYIKASHDNLIELMISAPLLGQLLAQYPMSEMTLRLAAIPYIISISIPSSK